MLLRRMAENPQESPPHTLRIREADVAGDGLDRLRTSLHFSGGPPLHGGVPPPWPRLPGLGQEDPPELTGTQASDLRQVLDRERLGQMFADIGQDIPDAVRLGPMSSMAENWDCPPGRR